MPIKINSYGGIITWYMRKHFSLYTSKLVLEFVSKKNEKLIKKYIKYFINANDIPQFKIVNIETINRCNGSCAFCPANAKEEKRELKRMSASLFAKIIDELKMIKWGGSCF